jgi:hypothetical protein
MKKFLYTAVITATLWSCGGGGDTPPTPVNHEPTTPTLVYPSNNLLCIDNPVVCKWNASTDSDQGDVITYQVEVAKNSAFTEAKQTFTVATIEQSVPLEENIAYYWRVKAIDDKNASSSYSTVYKFFTYGEGVTNHVPFAPELVSPALNAVVTTPTATLEWNGSDVDSSDTLTYDVYLDTVNPPTTVISANQSGDLFTTPTLSPTTDYYWKIVVKDNHGGQTIGQIWNFRTD